MKFHHEWLIVMALIAFLILPGASAAGETKFFDKDKPIKGQIEIVDNFGLPLISDKIATYTITSWTDQCLIECSGEWLVTLHRPERIFSDLKFKGTDKKEKSKPYKLMINSSEAYQEPVYERTCESINGANGTYQKCDNNLVRYDTKTREIFVPYNFEVMPEGSYKVRIEAKKDAMESIDVIPYAVDKSLDEWAWWNSSWSKKMQINITGGISALDNFTVYVNISTLNFCSKSDATDLRVVNGTETTELKFERDVNLTNSIGIWVKMPTLNVGTNTIYAYCGNLGASDGSDAVNAWDANYKAVYHLNGNLLDSKGIVNGTLAGAGTVVNATSCKFGSCYTFRNDDSWIQLDNTFDNYAETTVEGWGFATSTYDYQNIMGQSGGAGNRAFALRIDSGTTDVTMNVFNSAGTDKSATLTGVAGINKYNYLAGTTNGAVIPYCNTTTSAGTAFADTTDVSSNAAGIGAITTTGSDVIQEWVGEIDEVRFSTVTRNGVWINRSFQNGNFSNFVAGAIETLNVLEVTLNSPVAYFNTTYPIVSFNCSSVDDAGVLNISLILNGKINYTVTNSSAGQNLSLYRTLTLAEGYYNWTCNASDGTGITDPATKPERFLSVYAPNISICNASGVMKTPFINFTFADESSGDARNASINSFSITISDLNSQGLLSRTYTFLNLSNNPSYAFCVAPNVTANSSYSITYSSSEGGVYPQRSFSESNILLTNSTTARTLYLLLSTSGQYVTFQVVDIALNPLSGVSVTATRSGNIIDSKTTDDAGSATMWLDPLLTYSIQFTKSGYTTFTTSLTPTQTSYTITLSSIGGNTNVTDYNQGLIYSIAPVNNTLSPNKVYPFNFTIAPGSSQSLQSWGFYIKNSTTVLNSTSSSVTTGGTLNQILNISGQKYITIFANYTINNNTFFVTKTYVISDLSDTEYSISYLFTDLKAYLTTGFFGLDNFGIGLIIFAIIFITTGVMSYNYGIYSPAAISGIILALTAFFDVGLGMLDAVNPINAVAHFPTVFVGIIFVSLLIKEATSY